MHCRTSLRRATLAEIDALAEVYVDSRVKSGDTATRRSVDPDVVRRWLRKAVIHSEVWVLERVAESDNAESNEAEGDEPTISIAGVLALSDQDIEALDVAPSFRGLGYGDALITHAKSCRPRGLKARIPSGQRESRDFLVRHGFTPQSTQDSPWDDLVWRNEEPSDQPPS